MAPARRELLLQTALAPCFDAALAAALAGEEAARELDALVRQGHIAVSGIDARRNLRGAWTGAPGCAGIASVARRRRGGTHSCHEDRGPARSAWSARRRLRTADRVSGAGTRGPGPRIAGGEAGAFRRSGIGLRAAERLDDDVLVRHPWLCFWVGRVLQGIDEERARNWFERSYAGFAAAGDASGMRIAAASVVIAFVIEYGDIRTLETWLRRHVEAGGEHPVEQGSAHEATLCMGVVCAALNAGAYPATIDANTVTRRLQVLLDDPSVWLTRDQAVEAARLLVDHARGSPAASSAEHGPGHTRHVDDVDGGALQRGRWCLSAANAYLLDGKQELAERYLQQARTLVEQSGSRRLGFELAQARCQCCATQGRDTATPRRILRRSNHSSLPRPLHSVRSTRASRHGVMLAQHKYVEGLHWADEALECGNAGRIRWGRRARLRARARLRLLPPMVAPRKPHNWRGRWRRGCRARNSC